MSSVLLCMCVPFFFLFVPKSFKGRQNFRLDFMEYHVGRINLELVNKNSLLKGGCRVIHVHWSLCMNVGVYNQAQGHLPLLPPWDQAPGPSDSKFALAELKNKTGFQKCNGIISVSFKNRWSWPGKRGSPQLLQTLECMAAWKKVCGIGIFISDITVSFEEIL